MILGSRAGYNPTEMTKPAQMRQARFRFYAELNDLLSLGRRGRSFVHTFGIPPSLKDVIEAFDSSGRDVLVPLRLTDARPGHLGGADQCGLGTPVRDEGDTRH